MSAGASARPCGEGKVSIQYKKAVCFPPWENGEPEVIPEQAEVVRQIFRQYLAGASLRMIGESLESGQIPNVTGGGSVVHLRHPQHFDQREVLRRCAAQKTYVRDCISKQVVRNTGQLPMYLVRNNHQGIVDRKTFDAVQTEMARRSAGKSPSKKNASTGMTSYASKYALSERLVCGECGTLYRRCTWKKNGKSRVVWRCVSRLDYGRKYCHDSPTLDEGPLQQAILDAINRSMSRKGDLIGQITGAMELELSPIPGVTMSLADLDRRLAELETQFQDLLAGGSRGQLSGLYGTIQIHSR